MGKGSEFSIRPEPCSELDPQERRVHKVPQGFKALPAHKAKKVLREKTAHRGNPDRLVVLPVRLDPLDQWVCEGFRVLTERMAIQGHQVRQGHQDQQDLPVRSVHRGRLGFPVKTVRMASMAFPVLEASSASLERADLLVWACQGSMEKMA